MSEQGTKGAQPKFHVGQTVWMGNWRTRRAPRQVTVTKTARKYATVEAYGREEKFDLVTGRAPGESGWYIETEADRAEKLELAAIQERLRELGFRSLYDFPRNLSVDALRKIAAVVAADLSTPPTSPTDDEGASA